MPPYYSVSPAVTLDDRAYRDGMAEPTKRQNDTMSADNIGRHFDVIFGDRHVGT